MPLGSSSAAPVMRPGPSLASQPVRAGARLLAPGGTAFRSRCDGFGAGASTASSVAEVSAWGATAVIEGASGLLRVIDAPCLTVGCWAPGVLSAGLFLDSHQSEVTHAQKVSDDGISHRRMACTRERAVGERATPVGRCERVVAAKMESARGWAWAASGEAGGFRRRRALGLIDPVDALAFQDCDGRLGRDIRTAQHELAALSALENNVSHRREGALVVPDQCECAEPKPRAAFVDKSTHDTLRYSCRRAIGMVVGARKVPSIRVWDARANRYSSQKAYLRLSKNRLLRALNQVVNAFATAALGSKKAFDGLRS